MPSFTPRFKLPYPNEFDDPWFEGFKNYAVQVDSVLAALSENDNMRFIGGGDFSWTVATNILSWTEEIRVRTFTSPFAGVIAAQSFELAEGDVLFFQMFRSLTGDFTIELRKGKITSFDPVRNSDLIAFAFRLDNTIFLPGQISIRSGDFGPAFGSGLPSGGGGTPSDHQHVDPLVIEPGAIGITVLNLPLTAPVLLQVRLYRNGSRQNEGASNDYVEDLALGTLTLNTPTQDIDEVFVIDMIRTP